MSFDKKFVIPNDVIVTEHGDSCSTFLFEPLERGYGVTVGNALRRVLLSSMCGYAVQAIRVPGVNNEFGVIEGVKEDVMNIILNLKKVRLVKTKGNIDSEKVSISLSNDCVDGKFINSYLSNFKIVNEDLIICHSSPSLNIMIDLYIGYGRGYEGATEHNQIFENDVIAIDSIYSPIKNVSFDVSSARVGKKVDYDSLSFTVTTDGTVSPMDVIVKSSKILSDLFALFNEDKFLSNSEVSYLDIDDLKLKKVLSLNISDLVRSGELSSRAYNCLVGGGVHTVKDLVSLDEGTLKSLKNVGKKTLNEISTFLKNNQLSLKMSLSSINTSI